MAREKTPMSRAMYCWANIPTPTFTFGFRTQHRSGALALPDP
jgi:hypothetical protein